MRLLPLVKRRRRAQFDEIPVHVESDTYVAQEEAAVETVVPAERTSLQGVFIPPVIESAVLPPPADKQGVLQKVVLPAND